MPFEKKYDKEAAKVAWESWARGERPDLSTITALASDIKVHPMWLYKKTAKWRRDLKAKLEADLGQMTASTPSRAKRKDAKAIGRQGKGRLNANSPLSPSYLGYTDEFRKARQLGKDNLSIAMQGLIDEATTGTGASRVSAIRELLDRSGLAKDKERKDEPSPYEEEDSLVLKDRLIELVGSNTMLTSLLTRPALTDGDPGMKNPTTSQAPLINNPITPSPSGLQVSCVLPGGSEVVEPGEVGCVEVVPGYQTRDEYVGELMSRGPSVMLT